MDEQIDKAIKQLRTRVLKDTQPDAGLKHTQAALNLAHVKSVLANIDLQKPKTKGAGA